MDGRIQIPVIRYLQKRFNTEYVDTITEAGPNLILADGTDDRAITSIFNRLTISTDNHQSVGIAVIGHHDCAGNQAPADKQQQHIQQAVHFLRRHYDKLEIIGLWVDEKQTVHDVMI
jgi:hypothetical protein